MDTGQRTSVLSQSKYIIFDLPVYFLLTSSFLCSVIHYSHSIHLDRINIPGPLESGHHHESVVLDCVYSYNRSVDKNLVVKWFRNNETTPLYQWIPAVDTRIFHHSYKDYVDELYKHNDEPLEMFRALRIRKPVRQISGLFSCEVISDDDVQQMSQYLYIYDKPINFEIHLNHSTNRLHCEALTTHSSAVLSLYKVDYDTSGIAINKVSLETNAIIQGGRQQNSTESNQRPARDSQQDDQGDNGITIHKVTTGVILDDSDLRVNEVGASRVFTCDMIFINIPNVILQRSIQIVNEFPFDVEEESPVPSVLAQIWTSTSTRPSTVSTSVLFLEVVLCILYVWPSL